MKTTTSPDLIATFLAKGGKVRKVSAGERTMPEREMFVAAHATDEEREKEARRAARRAEREAEGGITEVVDHCGRSRFRNAQGEWLS